MIYVINHDGRPLMPCRPAVARVLLQEGKARVLRKEPFTIKLNYMATSYTQPMTKGLDVGSKNIGAAVVADNGDALYASTTETRSDIPERMKQRKEYRRNRRSRNTRYREPRFDNRANSTKKGKLSPTIVSKINSHLKEMAFIDSILPITRTVIEIGKFDMHAMKNPEVLENKWLYQQGTNYGFANVREYVKWRDGYKCVVCGKKSKGKRLEIHHKVARKDSGSDDESNLVTLCEDCHYKHHNVKEIEFKKEGKKKDLKDATQTNVISKQLQKYFPLAQFTYGYVTKMHREQLGLIKDHHFDAVVIACLPNIERTGELNVKFVTDELFRKRSIPRGEYQLAHGKRSQNKLPTGKICGFKLYDKVKYEGIICFIKGRRSTGYFSLMDFNKKELVTEHTPKVKLITRLSARKSVMVYKDKLQVV